MGRSILDLAIGTGLLALLAGGCAVNTAPGGWLPHPDDAQREAYGGWIEVSYIDTENQPQAKAGELISITADSLHVLTYERLLRLSIHSVDKAQVIGYDAKAGVLEGWTILGALSGISHGYGLIASVPIWIVVGSATTAGQSRAPVEKYAKRNWVELRRYARFPQGLPAGVDLSLLTPKPLDEPDQTRRSDGKGDHEWTDSP